MSNDRMRPSDPACRVGIASFHETPSHDYAGPVALADRSIAAALRGAERVRAAAMTGLAGDAYVSTPRGPIRVGALRPGDRVTTRDGSARPVRAIDRVMARNMRPCLLSVSSRNAPGAPCHLLVAPEQPIWIEDWRADIYAGAAAAAIPADWLVDGERVRRFAGPLDVMLWRPRFDAPQTIYANGVAVLADTRSPVVIAEPYVCGVEDTALEGVGRRDDVAPCADGSDRRPPATGFGTPVVPGAEIGQSRARRTAR